MDVAKWHMFTSCSSGSKAKRQGRAKAPLLWPGPPPPPGKNRKIGNTFFKSSYTNFYDFPQLVMTIF